MQSLFRLSVLFLLFTVAAGLALAACEPTTIPTSVSSSVTPSHAGPIPTSTEAPTPTNTPRVLATCVTNPETTTQCVFSDTAGNTIKIVVLPQVQATPQRLVLWNLEVQPEPSATPPPKSTLIRTVINLDVTTDSTPPVHVYEFNPALILTAENLKQEYDWMISSDHRDDVAKGKKIRMYVFDNQNNMWRAVTTLSSITTTNTLSMTIGIDHLPGNDADCDTRFD